MKTIENVKNGELVLIGKKVYIRNEYVRELKKYSLTDWHDTSREKLVKKGTLVNVNFTF